MQCHKCKKTNPEESNFCSRCGITLNQKVKCPICLETKKTCILICGHTACIDCLDKIYEIKNECPICRTNIYKCDRCNSFRVTETLEKKECLDCKHITKLLIREEETNKIICIDCKSVRVLYNTNDKWSCMDCFCNFTISNNISSLDNTVSTTTKICSLCCSNDIEYKEFATENKCLNCERDNVTLRHITLEEYSHLRIKSKEEINKTFEKIYCCIECDSSDICKIANLNDPLEKLYFCKKCNKSGVKVKEVL
tara:strand:+ start:50 stop:808 length:759 start_codon:yes stop_codon:yes gene_type:complete